MSVLLRAGLVGLALSFASLAVAAPGELDPSFGDPPGYAWQGSMKQRDVYATVVDAHGRLLIAGYDDAAENPMPFIKRYLATGVLDQSFGFTGHTSPGPVPEAIAAGLAMARGTNRTYLALPVQNGVRVYAFTDTGALDAAFGNQGRADIVLGANPYPVLDLKVQNGRPLIATGTTQPVNGNRDFVLARLTTTGAADASFGTNGIARHRRYSGPGTRNVLTRIALLPNGQIVAAGRAMGPIGHHEAVVGRFFANGALDTSFGSAGFATLNLGPETKGRTIGVESDGKLVSAGMTCNSDEASANYECQPFAYRLHANGALDTSYGNAGVFRTTLDYYGFLGEALVDAQNRLVFAGSMTFLDGRTVAYVARLGTNGQYDPVFGPQGGGISRWAYVSVRDPEARNVHLALTRDAAGRLIAAGHASDGELWYSILARYQP